MVRAYDDYGNVVELVEWEQQIRADVIDEVETVLNEITQKYIERYGADIVELYSEVLTEFVEWLKEKKNDER